ncbi:hypothetical protein [Streptomyces hundungensis]|uniref:hypothetical protein n=1 Tax=Streptomyces hundungensis TaxID=1077946 RepID=UPI0013C4EA72|nr:hypothetical protein [Streptomyces hundungensis]
MARTSDRRYGSIAPPDDKMGNLGGIPLFTAYRVRVKLWGVQIAAASGSDSLAPGTISTNGQFTAQGASRSGMVNTKQH